MRRRASTKLMLRGRSAAFRRWSKWKSRRTRDSRRQQSAGALHFQRGQQHLNLRSSENRDERFLCAYVFFTDGATLSLANVQLAKYFFATGRDCGYLRFLA